MCNLTWSSYSTVENAYRSVDERVYLPLNIFYFYFLHLFHKCNYDYTLTGYELKRWRCATPTVVVDGQNTIIDQQMEEKSAVPASALDKMLAMLGD